MAVNQKKIWMIVRHGTRNPSASSMEKIKSRLPQIKDLVVKNDGLPNDYIKNRDLDLLRTWKMKLDVKDEYKLTHEGEEEMLLLAERMQSRFPQIFDNVYSNTSYKFKYTYTQRTQKSAFYFAAGLFGKKTAKSVWFPEPSKKDPILRFYKLCDKWHKEVKYNPKTEEHRRIFEQSPKMFTVVNVVNKRLNLTNHLTTEDVITMYKACAFETAWNKLGKSPWCSPFTENELKILEYAEDLKYYWQDGYGHELTYKQACPAFSDMISILTSKDQFPKVTVYFTHSGTILKMLAHIGLYKDDGNLTATDYDKIHNRKWRTSQIDSFASNLAFILFRCGKKDKILTMHQETVIRLPSCPNTDLCEIEKINAFYSESINGCNFKALCAI
ncbi:hypothetical protein NQ318_010896 [Aromia moschata]|uniref:Multiple inositol polyphosphate phosphatase 1 n=1 Tax=Aromia moschata TaxID=1265417 RepID=A0AAV8XKV5_9CUCU|nr:hypothetical protein NQ318_010896 [Aromia moschata]